MGTFANHMALTLERAQLRERALRIELLEKIDRLQRALLSAVSHDLRTPLSTVKMSASTFRNPALDVAPEQEIELLELIDHQADRLDRLVANLLDLNRMQAGVLDLHREPIAVVDLVADALRGLGPVADEAPVTVTMADDLPLVDVDHVLIGQVLKNLIENAVRHAPPGTAVTVSACPGPDGRLTVTVDDAGPGVPPGEWSEVFTAFNRRGAAGGTGVGLSIAKGFMEAHGQEIRVERRAGRRGTLLLHPAGGRRRHGGVVTRVLAVDDDQALLRVLRIGLSSLGYSVLTAATGEQGVTQAAMGAPDVVVLDLGLPDLDGLEVCRRLRQWSAVPIIVLSADGTEDRKIAALDGGADDYMTKPFGMGELEARLRVALRHRAVDDGEAEPQHLEVGPLELDLVHHEARMDGRTVELTTREFALARLPGTPRRKDLHAPPDPGARVGAALRIRDPVPARLRLPAQEEARRRAR